MRGLELCVLSKQFSLLAMHAIAADFFVAYKAQLLAQLDVATLQEMSANIAASLLDPLTSLHEEGGGFWQEVMCDLSYYDMQVDAVVAELQELDVRQSESGRVRQSAEQILYSGESRKSLALMVFGSQHLRDYQQLLGDGDKQWLSKHGLFCQEGREAECAALTSIDAVRDWKKTLRLSEHYLHQRSDALRCCQASRHSVL
jgi:hypothetical protein